MPGAGWLGPAWAGDERVGAAMTTRAGGCSAPPWDGYNLGLHVGDDPATVAANRADFAARLAGSGDAPVTPVYLQQVHGSTVVRLGPADALPGAEPHRADAAVTTERGIACTVLVADCLPMLMKAPQGRGVGAAHAGWRGLAQGVADACLAALCEAAHCAPAAVEVWLGACIGPTRFEVGADVLEAFGVAPGAAQTPGFAPAPARAGVPKWQADLAGLARRRLERLGVRSVSGGGFCTASDASRFFSFRRDGVTGRLAAAIWLR